MSATLPQPFAADAPTRTPFAWFTQPCTAAFAVLRRRLGFSEPFVAAGDSGCRVEFARRGLVVAVTYWLGLAPQVELLRADRGGGTRRQVPWLPPRPLPPPLETLHARLRAPPANRLLDEPLSVADLTDAERRTLARALGGYLRAVAADLLRRQRDAGMRFTV